MTLQIGVWIVLGPTTDAHRMVPDDHYQGGGQNHVDGGFEVHVTEFAGGDSTLKCSANYAASTKDYCIVIVDSEFGEVPGFTDNQVG